MSNNFRLKGGPIIVLILGLSFVFLPSDLRLFANSWSIATKTLENSPIWDQTIGEGWNLTLVQTIKHGIATSLIQTTDDHFILAGRLKSTNRSYIEKIWLVKTDLNGVVLWNQTYSDRRAVATSVLQAVDGGYLLAGWIYLGTQDDMWLIKTDPNGVALWNRTYRRPDNNRCRSLIQTKDGSLLLAGTTCFYNSEERDMLLIKTDPNGVALWNRTYGDGYPIEETAQSVLQAADGGYLLAGQIRSHEVGFGQSDIWLVKTDPNGVALWNKTYGDLDNHEQCHSMIPTKDGNVLLVGWTRPCNNSNIEDMLLVKVDPNGMVLWNQTYGDPKAFDIANTAIQTPDGGFLVVGNTGSKLSWTSDILLLKTNSTGSHEWHMIIGEGSNILDYCSDIIQTSDENFMLLGYSIRDWQDNPNPDLANTYYTRLLKLENPLKSSSSHELILGFILVSGLGVLCMIPLVIRQKKTWRKARKSLPQEEE